VVDFEVGRRVVGILPRNRLPTEAAARERTVDLVHEAALTRAKPPRFAADFARGTRAK